MFTAQSYRVVQTWVARQSQPYQLDIGTKQPMAGKSTLSTRSLGLLLVVSLLFVQWFGVHLHLYDHQHPLDLHAAHQPTYHTGLVQSSLDHHNETITVATAHPFITKALNSHPNLTFILLASILFALFPQTRNSASRTDALCFHIRRFLLPPPARAPPAWLR